ncbi:porin [Verminephrobacter eiseniae]|uniref:porin n=1 Tax=Verminephrobacter eiseniae TaxID=364317 RepID=UPI0022373C50|nr:porin [Verminephrobacter eiseniae]MCW5237469.1 porin [Verminephrobacter eiseniae]
MKVPCKFIVSAGLLATCAGVSAQSSVTVYGLMDLAVERVTNVGPIHGQVTRMPSLTGSLPSRLGFRGTEDLGGGLSAGFTLEMGIAPDSGALNQGGRSFGRQSFVSVGGPWGTVGMGRQYTALYWSLLGSDVMGPSLHTFANLDSYIPNTRTDDSISYRGNFFDGLSVGATYSLGRDVVNAGPSPAGTHCPGESATDKRACRGWSAYAKYDKPTWGVAIAIDEIRGGPGAFGGLILSSMKDTRSTLNGYLKFGEIKIGGGLIPRNNDASVATPRSDLWFIGLSYPLTPVLILDAQYSQLKFDRSANKATHPVARVTYFLSKRTAVYASVGHITNRGSLALAVSAAQPGSAPVAGGSQNGVGFGLRHSF